MKRIIPFIILFIFIRISYLNAQHREFKAGYIITQTNDTIRGTIAYLENRKKNQICVFKNEKNGELKEYEPDELKSYKFIDDKLFSSQRIETRKDVNEQVFLEELVTGGVSLYKYKELYFFGINGEDLVKLNTEIIGENSKITQKNKHIGIITSYLVPACPEIREQIMQVKLAEKPLTLLLENYNSCIGAPFISHKLNKRWATLAFNITSGFNTSSLKFTGSYSHLLSDFSRSNSLAIGGAIEIVSPRLNERLGLNLGMFYLSSDYQTTNTIIVGLTTYSNSVSFAMKTIKVPIGIKLKFRSNKFNSYTTFGISKTFHNISENNWDWERERKDVVSLFHEEALFTNRNQLGMWAAYGFNKSITESIKGLFEVRIEKTDGIAHNDLRLTGEVFSRIINWQMMVGIVF
ncbi:MAG: hypothetical protein OEW75_18095 [Cyclobacteriaceae bacterium]|nr:hypothetical protein [Cyclobacteriaceae bacterium]